MEYRALLRFAGVLSLVVLTASASSPASRFPPPASRFPPPASRITVFKDPNCGCCRNWIDYLRTHGFEVSARDTADLGGVKRTGRVPERLHSCHTAFVSGYVVEGHVPAADIQRLLREKPKLSGIAVAGMPVGSPGMEAGVRMDRYDVVAFNRDGTTRVFARH